MISRIGRHYYWDAEDARAMTAILGPEGASKKKVPLLHSVLRAAKRKGVALTPTLDLVLHEAVQERQRLKGIRVKGDVSLDGLDYPEDLVEQLWGHQRVALSYMDPLPSYLLADQPGVGKTPAAILWASRRAKNVLVITPGKAREQWARAIDSWSFNSMPSAIVEGRVGEQRAIISSHEGWVVGHWETMVHARDAILERTWDAVILDEGHAIRNRKTKRAATAFDLTAKYRLFLSGHPFLKAPDELWSTLRFLYPATYTSFWRYFSMHVLAQPSYFGGMEIIGARQPKLLRWEMAPFSLRRTKRRVFKTLPPVTRVQVAVDLPPKHAREYKRLKKEFFVQLEGEVDKKGRVLAIFNELSRTTRVRQFLVDPGLIESSNPSLKYPAVLELMEELDGPPVIFTLFRQAAEALAARMKKEGYKVGMIVGGAGRSKKKKRASEKAQSRFLKGRLDALIVMAQTGGEALNLGKYGYVIFLDLPWNAADLEQCEGRVDRPEEGTGKMVPTTSYRIVIRDSYETKRMEKRLEHKKNMFDEVFDRHTLERLF